ncbi:hypothetical protein DQ04_07731020 [Trypanosoma grayi]|uniref:hypothetical protein n=1 Tax=Trypanosoma grayi TaxID=71804 RepID=UPI0004F40EE4|nr:hypothetical protein DQ04_07731020 [Trypanosoma grayi]KEG08210.1 hypothetical protein DQ04_07731020 [Trypanosoma grayi]
MIFSAVCQDGWYDNPSLPRFTTTTLNTSGALRCSSRYTTLTDFSPAHPLGSSSHSPTARPSTVATAFLTTLSTSAGSCACAASCVKK